MITQERLKQLLHYDPTTGVFTRIKSNRADRLGKQPGAVNSKGYVQIRLDGTLYVAHRLAWLYCYGEFPKNQLDHFNGDKSDNKLSNLRHATNKQNQENVTIQINNTSGYRGVCFEKTRRGLKKFGAYVGHNGKRVRVGLFATADEAAVAAQTARDLLFTHHKTPYAS